MCCFTGRYLWDLLPTSLELPTYIMILAGKVCTKYNSFFKSLLPLYSITKTTDVKTCYEYTIIKTAKI